MMDKLKISAYLLKIIAMTTMLIDHIGALLFPQFIFLRIIGRISFPIYAFLIGEGCQKTRNKKKYLLNISITFAAFQCVQYLIDKSFSLCVLFGFMLSVAFAMVWEWSIKDIRMRFWAPTAAFLLFLIITTALPTSYSMFSFILPVISYIIKQKQIRFCMFATILIALSFFYQLQAYALLALIPLLMYNGERGRASGKYFFYAFYPLHYAVLGIIAALT